MTLARRRLARARTADHTQHYADRRQPLLHDMQWDTRGGTQHVVKCKGGPALRITSSYAQITSSC